MFEIIERDLEDILKEKIKSCNFAIENIDSLESIKHMDKVYLSRAQFRLTLIKEFNYDDTYEEVLKDVEEALKINPNNLNGQKLKVEVEELLKNS
ncbi:hypothetical protein [Clostridium senegalense]|uniref:Tetratricopeptide repeat protein n=1 Tax=Clostridium senegalense TaxID=1465809 RepID=A0A6M0H0K1_9CLOT|nr:hypothetical protein [Clostridium senegalense]NEU03728.1 hypothetical protein [Clostridium senegalense]